MTLRGLYSKFPSIDCGACFTPTCRSFARRCLLGLNSPHECPLLGWSEAGRKALEAEDALNAHRGVEAHREAKILGTQYSFYHPTSEGKIVDFLDMQTFIDLAQMSRVFDSTKSFAELEAVRLSKGERRFTVVSDGRVLPTGPGPPKIVALSALAGLMWGAVSGFRPILPTRRDDRVGVRGRRLQRVSRTIRRFAHMPCHSWWPPDRS